MKAEKKTRRSKNGGTFELAPIVATGALYTAALYNKKGRLLKGGSDKVVTTPGGAVPVVTTAKPEMPTKLEPSVAGKSVPAIALIPADVRRESPAAAIAGSASRSPLVTNMLDLNKNSYIGAVGSSRPALINSPATLLEGGGKKKRGAKKRGGSVCQAMNGGADAVPANTGAGGDVRAVPVVVGVVGGVSTQEEPALVGGAKRSKARKGKKRGGAEDGGSDAESVMMDGGAKKSKARKGKKRGGADDGGADDGGSDAEFVMMDGGAKKSKARKGKKRGGADDGGNSVESYIAGMKGGISPIDTLISDIQRHAQVGGKKKDMKGGFKLYAKELDTLSKKLKKLM